MTLQHLCTFHFAIGKITEDIEEFVESWRENLPQENILSRDASFNYEPPCLIQTQAFLQVGVTINVRELIEGSLMQKDSFCLYMSVPTFSISSLQILTPHPNCMSFFLKERAQA